MFDRLIDLLIQFIELFKFWYIVEDGEYCLVFTLGRATRERGARGGWFRTGFCLRLPLSIEEEYVVSIKREPHDTAITRITTKDGVLVNIAGVFWYSIIPDKIRNYLIELGDEDEALRSAAIAAIFDVAQAHTFQELHEKTEECEQEILLAVRKRLNHYGFKFYGFDMNEMVKSKAITLIGGF